MALEDAKSSAANAADSNGAKSTSLDHLGVIASKLRATVLKYKQAPDNDGAFASLDEVWKSLRWMITVLIVPV